MWAPALARASTATLRYSTCTAQQRSLYRHVRALCDKSGGKPDNDARGNSADPSSSDAPQSKYARYYVRRSPISPTSAGSSNTGSGGGGGGRGGNTWETWLPYVFGGGVAASYLWFISGRGSDGVERPIDVQQPGRQVSWKEFKAALPSGRVAKIEVVNGHMANVYYKDDISRPRMRFSIGSVELLERKLELAQEDLGIEPHEFVPVVFVEETAVARIIADWVPTLAFLAAYVFIARRFGGGGGLGGMGIPRASKPPSQRPFGGGAPSRPGSGPFGGMGGGAQGGIFNVGKANATVLNRDDNKVKITFKDVAGLDEAKAEIIEFVQYLRKPDKYKLLGAKIPKGALMYGPPGTGKTLLAKATAGEAGVPFLTMSGSDFMEMFVGVGPSRVRDLFAQARSMAPCIIFLDEIDAIGRKRGRGGFIGGNDERENTLNQLLVEMDGFASNSGVVVLAGTNRVDVLDQALLRPGRFDRQISIDAPDISGRRDIFNVHLGGITVADPPGKDHVAKAMSARTPGFAGADIANVCNEAALVAARANKEAVEVVDFDQAVDRVMIGLEKANRLMSPEEKRTIAHHEAGHAVAGWFLEHADPLLKVSIIPRGSAALGFAQYQVLERYLMSTEALQDQMCMTLAGRAAEELFFETVTTGASDDFSKVSRMAYKSVAEWGLGKTIRNLAFPESNDGDDGSSFYKPYSDRTARRIDEEVRDIVNNAYERSMQLLMEKKAEVKSVADLLLEKETINREDMVELLGERPFGRHRSTFDEILQDSGAHATPAPTI